MGEMKYEVKHCAISGFRRLYGVNIEMRPLMVMIGANGVGKSSMLDAFSLLSATAAGKMNSQMNALGGISNLLTNDYAKELAFCIEMNIPS